MLQIRNAFVVAVLVLLTGGTGFAQDSTRADFDAYCDDMVGRWVGDVTWISDWPGLGKKGDKVKAYCEMRRTEDGNALIGRFYGGGGSGTWLAVYDAGSKQIRESNVTSGGSVWTHIYKKTKDGWSCTSTGSNPDGAKISQTLAVEVTNGGDTHKWTGTTTIGGKEQDPLNDVWRRVAK